LCPLSSEQIDHLRQKKSLQSHPIDRAFWVFLNTQHPSLSSPLIRKALSLAIDRETITHKVLVGGDPLDKPLPHALLPKHGHSEIHENKGEAQKIFEKGLAELGYTKKSFPPLVI